MSANGIFQGYSWYDKHDVAPLFPFGHGLSYTTFGYSKLRRSSRSADGGMDVSLPRPQHRRAGRDEVPQVYVGPSASNPDGVELARKSLGAFERIELARGDAADVKLHVAPRELSYWSTSKHAGCSRPASARCTSGRRPATSASRRRSTCQGLRLGVKTIGSEVDANQAGMAEAFRAVAPADGTIETD